VALDFGLIELGPVLELVNNKPTRLELVFTGRDAHPEVIEAADLVSEVREVKHHYKNGVPGREGVEY
jgi:cob(I)alamin adenosyltransferase